MSNHYSHAALPYPIRNARYTIPVPYLDADGDPTDPTTPDTEISKDAGAFADCTEEVSTISGSNGMGYITLTSTEMDASLVCIAAKVASGPKATLAMLQPRILPVISNGTAQAGGNTSITLASGAPAYDLTGCFVRTTGGTGGGSGVNQARIITAYDTGTKVATVSPAWETNPDSTTTYDILMSDMAVCHAVSDKTGYSLSATPPTAAAIADAVWDEAISGHADSGTTGAALSAAGSSGDPWETSLPGSYGSGTAGNIIGNRIDAAITSRSSHSAADVWAVTTRTLSSFGTLVSDITTAVWSAGTRTLSGFGSLVADIWSYATRALTDKAGFTISGTKQTLDALNDVSSSTVRTQADAALAAYDAPTKAELDAAVAPLATVKTTTDKLDTAMQQDGSVYRFTQNALELAPTGSGGGSGLAGSNPVTVTVHDGAGANIVEAAVEVWDSAGTTFYERKTSDSSGQASFNMDDGTYTVKIHKAGYSIADQTLVVPDTLAPTYVMTAFVIPVSPDLTKCRVWMKLINTYTSLTVSADVPENLTGNNLVMGNYTGVYDTVNNLVYWDIPIGAVNSVLKITELNFEVVVPLILDLESSELKDLI